MTDITGDPNQVASPQQTPRTFTPGDLVGDPSNQQLESEGFSGSSMEAATSFDQQPIEDRRQAMSDFFTFSAPATVAGFIDTLGMSVGVFDEKDLTETITNLNTAFGSYYAENRDTFRAGGDLAGFFIPGIAATKMVRAGSALQRGIQSTRFANNRYLNSVFTSGKSYEQVMQAVRAADLKAAKAGQTDFSLMAGTTRRKLANRAIGTKLLDTAKENIAFELGVLATMNSSDIIYPDEFELVDHVALGAAPIAIFGAAEFAYMKKLLRKSAREAGPIGTAMRNIEDMPQEAFQSRSGERDIKAFYLAANRRAAQDLKAKAPDSQTASNFNLEELQLGKELEEEYTRMARDKPLPGITSARQLDPAELKTMMNGADTNPFDLIGTLSLERMPRTLEEIQDKFFQAQKDEIVKLQSKINNTQASINAALNKGDYPDKLLAERAQLEATKAQVENAEFYVKEPTGELVDLAERKPIYQDGERIIRELRATKNEPKMFAIQLDDGSQAAVSENFLFIVPGVKEQQINRVNVTKILRDSSEIDKTEDTRLLLEDMGKDWHYRSGARGKEVFDSLPAELQRTIFDWVGNSASSDLRAWQKTGDERFMQVYGAYAGVRARLRELADPDGTIPLLRGESKAETSLINRFVRGEELSEGQLASINDVVSMTSKPHVAGGFGAGGNLVVRRVPVEDVIMIVGGAGDEFEFIVKGNTKRAFGETVTNRNFNALSLMDRSKLYAAGQKAIEKFNFTGEKIAIHQGSHHTTVDAVLELHRIHGEKIFDWIEMPAGLSSIDDLEYISLASKYSEYADIRKFMEADISGVLKLADNQKLNRVDIAKMLNMPIHHGGDVDPITLMFENFIAQGETSFRSAVRSMDDFREMIKADVFERGIAEPLTDIKMRGNMFNVPEDAKPVTIVKRPVEPEHISREAIRNQAIANRTRTRELMGRAQEEGNAELVQLIFDTIELTDARFAAREVGNLVEGTQRTKGSFLSQPFSAAENRAIRAVDDINAVVNRRARTLFEEKLRPHVNVFSRLRAANNEADLASFNMFAHARLQQWDLADDVVRNEDGTFSFKLMDTKYNRDRYNDMFGTELKELEDVMMPAPTGKGAEYIPLQISELAMEGVNSVRAIDDFVFQNMNHLRRVLGRAPMNKKAWHIPPKNLHGKDVQFLVTQDGRLKQIVSGRTEKDAIRRANREIELDPTLMRVPPEAAEKYFNLMDRGFENLVDFSDIFLQTPKRATGRAIGGIIDVGDSVLNEMVDTLRKQMESVTRRSLLAYFEPEVQYAKHLHAASGVSTTTAQKGQSVWQNYIAALSGNPTLNPNDVVGKAYFTAENLYDNMLEILHDNAVLQFKPAGGLTEEATRKQDKTYRALQEQLGEFNPFQSAADFANRTEEARLPASMRTNMAQLNQFTSLLVLRFLDAGHALLNMTSLAATLPPVIKALNRLPDESVDDWSTRIGAYGLRLDDTIAQFSPVRLMNTTVHRYFNDPTFREAMEEASKRGLFDQEVAEMMKTITEPRQGYVEGIVRKFTNYASVLSDKSERLSRAFSFASGYHIGTEGLGLSKGNAMVFAHRFANDVIGDYRPNARPRIYQGAMGMPVGLFMTFMQNYYQRIFNYIENRQVKALVTQFATQASVFGAASVPGFQQFADFFYSNYDGTVNPVDGFDRHFGKDLSELMLYGSVSNLPKLFGADDGIALYSRGDVNFARIPGVWSIDQTPVFNMAKQFTEGTLKALQSLRQNGGVNTQQLMEITANYSISRPIKGMMELVSGYSTDKRGQVVNSEVRDGMSVAARLMSLRPLSEAKRRETYGRVRLTERSQRQRAVRLRDSIRASIRAGEFNADTMNMAVRDYVKNGGNPEYFSRFLTQQFLASQVDRDSREFIEAMKDPTRGYDVLRLMSSLGISPNDPEFETNQGEQ